MTQEELTDINALFGGLSDDNNTNANNYDIIIRNQTSGNAMKVPLAIFKQVVYNYLTSASVAAGLASVLGVGSILWQGQFSTLADIDNLSNTGISYLAGTGLSTPEGRDGLIFTIVHNSNHAYRWQLKTVDAGNYFLMRTRTGNGWTAWRSITMS